jgi:hypothetical protein
MNLHARNLMGAIYRNIELTPNNEIRKDWDGKLDVSENSIITSLVGVPEVINRGSFYCNNCVNLKSLVGGPKQVYDDFMCSNNPLIKTLEGAPKLVAGDFICENCVSLKTLEGAPDEVYSFQIKKCVSLTSLKGSPKKVNNNYNADYCEKLSSIEGVTSDIDGYFSVSFCKSLTSFKDIHKHIKRINGDIYADGSGVKSHILGVMLIEGCQKLVIDDHGVRDIVNKWLREPMSKQRMINCQSELIEAGFEEYAQL